MSKRDYAIDFIRLVAIIGVVLIHTSSTFTNLEPIHSLSFFAVHAINQFARFAVPLFFGISGYLLAMRYFDIKSPWTFYKRRVSRILLPYFTWTLIYFLFIFPNPIESIFSIKFLDNLLAGKASYQLYFIPIIIIFYAIFPLIIFFKKYLLSKWSIAILLILETLILTNAFVGQKDIPLYPPLKDALYNLLPFMVGIYAGINQIDMYKWVKKRLLFLVFAFLLLWGFMIFDTLLLFNSSLNTFYLRHQWRIEVMVYGIISGGLLYYFYKTYLSKYSRQVLYLARFAFGIFFVHVAILHYTMRYFIERNGYSGFMWFAVVFIGVTLISLLFCIVVSKMKILDRLLGIRG